MLNHSKNKTKQQQKTVILPTFQQETKQVTYCLVSWVCITYVFKMPNKVFIRKKNARLSASGLKQVMMVSKKTILVLKKGRMYLYAVSSVMLTF